MQKIIVDSNDIYEGNEEETSRRGFLKTAGLVTGGLALGELDMFAGSRGKDKTLNLHNIHFNKTYHANFSNGKNYNISGLFQIDKALMDHRAWQIARIDLKLVNLLYQINRSVGSHHKINIISGYRSPSTNRKLRKRSRGVAKKSYHMKAQAVDIQIPGVRLSKVRSVARSLKDGGVGYYPRSNFIHLDVGPVRSWRRG